MPNTQQERASDQEMRKVRASLDRLEHGEWWRWVSALVIMLLLTAGVFVLTEAEGLSGTDRGRLVNVEHGLVGLVLLFDAYVIYQRVLDSRLRRQLAMQIAAITAVETLRPVAPREEGQPERRRWGRSSLDELLKVEVIAEGRKRLAYGRLQNITESGAGAVVPDTLNPGDPVVLWFTLGRNTAFRLEAVVRNRRGFQYGLEFVDLSESVAERLKQTLQALE